MRILHVNKFYYRRGGAETYCLEMMKKLAAEGHEVAIFSMHHPKNLPSPWSKFFVSRLSFNEGNKLEKIRGALRLLYNFEARRKFRALVLEFKPDIIHLHNIYHQLSPSFLPIAKQYGIPIVMHLHDYKLICPNYSLYDGSHICEDCAWPHYWRCFFKKCFGSSYFKSFLVSLEMFFHKKVLKIYEKNIAAYIAPSQFMKELCARHGLQSSNIITLYNFILHDDETKPTITHDSFLYFGRLAKEKGIYVLLQALEQLPTSHLMIAGEGPEESSIKQYIVDHNLSARVSLLGRLEGYSLSDIIARAQAIIMPSVWFENMPFGLLESLSSGKIVIASRIGGFPEIIKNNKNGFLCEPGDVQALAEVITDVSHLSLEQKNKITVAARQSVAHLNIDNHYHELTEIYEKVIKNYS